MNKLESPDPNNAPILQNIMHSGQWFMRGRFLCRPSVVCLASIFFFKWLLLKNHQANFNQTW